MKHVGIGIVGLGRISEDVHLPRAQTTAGMKLVAAADITPSRREKLGGSLKCPIHADFEQLLARDDVDLVVVATPSRFHHEQVLAALRAGKHVMVEKPMAMSVVEAREMAEEARSLNRILTVHHNRRFDGDFLLVKKLVDEGRLGELVSVERRMHTGHWIHDYAAQDYRPGWRMERHYGGGNIYDWGPHFFDQLLSIVERPPQSVTAWLRSVRWSSEVDDYFKLVVTWPNGVLGQIEASYVSPCALPAWCVVGKEATLSQQSWDDPFLLTPAEGDPEEIPAEPSRWGDIYENLAAAAQGRVRPLVSLEQCLATMELIEAAVRSDGQGQSIRLPLE